MRQPLFSSLSPLSSLFIAIYGQNRQFFPFFSQKKPVFFVDYADFKIIDE